MNKKAKLFLFLIIVYFFIFIFGQLLRLKISLLNIEITLQAIDIIPLISLILYLFGFMKNNNSFRLISVFFASSFFSLLLSLTLFTKTEIIIGSLYLLRLISYSTFFLMVSNYINKSTAKKKYLYNILLFVTFIVGFFAWIQFVWFPDLRDLRYVGWDDHLYRMVGTFLDPTFTAIILVFGYVLSLNKLLYKKENRLFFIVLLLYFLISVLFTYTRAAYLALLLITISSVIIYKKVKIGLAIVVLFIILIPFLPRPSSEGVKLERLHSLFLKLQNYQQTFFIFSKHPLFGVGYNNLCAARIRYFNDFGYQSHSCSGSDSSLLLVLATNGIVGFIISFSIIRKIFRSLKSNLYTKGFVLCSAALFIHSLFVNSMFYPWTLVFVLVLYAMTI